MTNPKGRLRGRLATAVPRARSSKCQAQKTDMGEPVPSAGHVQVVRVRAGKHTTCAN